MPQMSGIDFIEKIREKDTNCKVKIILSSAFIKRDLILDNTKINSLSIDKIIEKPIRLEILKDEVQKLVRVYSIIQIKYFYKINQKSN